MRTATKDALGRVIQPITSAATTDALAKSRLAMTGASIPLVAADPLRALVIVGSDAGNGAVTVDITGGNAGAGGLTVGGGDFLQITGREAQAAMTVTGTAGQSVTLYIGS